jgi:hypothetical protein
MQSGNTTLKSTRIWLFTALTIFITAATLAQSGGDFEIVNSTIDNGGGLASSGEFSLTGTIGQPEANHQSSSGGKFLLSGGFWSRVSDVIFKNGFEDD